MQVIRTLIADDHPIFRKGLKSLLRQLKAPAFELVGEASDGGQVLELVEQFNPQLLLLDMNMPQVDGLELLKRLKERKTDVHKLVISMYESPKLIRSAIKYGADGYLLKDRSPGELSKAVRAILSGETYLGEGVQLHRQRVADRPKRVGQYVASDRFVKKHSLTKREMEILELITQAMSNKEIGRTLFISDQTVSVHRKNIMRKLGVSNTAGLIKTAYDNSLV